MQKNRRLKCKRCKESFLGIAYHNFNILYRDNSIYGYVNYNENNNWHIYHYIYIYIYIYI